MNGVDAELVDDDSGGEGLVPGVDAQCAIFLVESVPLSKDKILDPHDFLQKVRGVHIELSPSVNHVNSVGLWKEKETEMTELYWLFAT